MCASNPLRSVVWCAEARRLLLGVFLFLGCGASEPPGPAEPAFDPQTPAARRVAPLLDRRDFPAGSSEELRLGRGFNTLTGELKDSCIEALESISIQPSSEERFSLQLMYVEQARDFLHTLALSPAAFFRFGYFREEPASLYLERGPTPYGSHLLIRAIAVERVESLRSRRLTELGLEKWESGRAEFLSACGNRFVTGRIVGTELLAVLEALSHDVSGQESIAALLEEIAHLFDAEPRKALRLLRSLENSSQVEFSIVEGRSPELRRKLQTPEDLVRYAMQGAETLLNASENAQPLFGVLSEYHTVENRPEWPPEGSVPDLRGREALLARIAEGVARAYEMRGGIRFVTQRREEFNIDSVDRFRLACEKIEAYIQDALLLSRRCAERPGFACAKLQGLGFPAVGLPSRTQWLELDVRTSIPQCLGTVPAGQKWLIHIAGHWSPWSIDEPDAWLGPDTLEVRLRSPDETTSTFFGLLEVPGERDVCLRVPDQHPADNRSDELTAALYLPLRSGDEPSLRRIFSACQAIR